MSDVEFSHVRGDSPHEIINISPTVNVLGEGGVSHFGRHSDHLDP